MSVGEICNREVVVARRTESALDAAKLMREYHVGDVVVIDERQGQRVPVGIITDRDIVVELVAKGIAAESVSLGDMMMTDLLVVSEESSISELVESMRLRGVRRVPVTNNQGGLVGLVAMDDLVDLSAEQLTSLAGVIIREHKREEHTRL